MRLLTQYLMTATLGAAGSQGVLAQSQRGSVEQIGSSQPVGMQQVANRPIGASLGGPPDNATAPQLTSASESAAPALQLTRERGPGPAAQQLTRGAPTAQPSQPLSKPADGRTGTVERVAGSDRCDPQAERPRGPRCAQVIETRAAEFTRRDPTPLSPEQRIIVEQQARERSGNFGGAARRLAANGDDARSLEAQGVASVVLREPPTDPTSDRNGVEASASEAMTAIVNAIVNAPPVP